MPSAMPTKQRINEEKTGKKEDPKTRKKTFQCESFEENAKGRRHHFLTASFMAFLEQRSQPIDIVQKYVLAPIPPAHHMVDGPGVLDP